MATFLTAQEAGEPCVYSNLKNISRGNIKHVSFVFVFQSHDTQKEVLVTEVSGTVSEETENGTSKDGSALVNAGRISLS